MPQAQPMPQGQQVAPPMQPRGNYPVASAAPISNDPSPIRPIPGGRSGDAFDPNANPNAPGAPRPLGALPAGQPSAPESPVGASGGREPGQPLDLSNVRGGGAAPNAVASVAPPTNTPRDQYDLGAGYIQRKDYALAEQAFREFLRRYPNDRLVADAQFWLGESQFQRQQYREAADAFLAVSTKHETAAKAPDSLLRLGQSLAALGEKESACATLAEVGRKYPRAALNVRQGVEREQKRVKC
jgi:tol-pal system protein YbgF